MADAELTGIVKWLGAGGVLGWLLAVLRLQRVMVSKKTCSESKHACIRTIDVKLDSQGRDIADIKRLVEKMAGDLYVPRAGR